MRKWLLRFLLIMLLALSGCATVTNTVKVGLDGKTDLSFDLKLAKLAGLFTGQVDEQVKEKLEQQGFSVEEKSKTHYLVKKTVKSSGKKSISKAKLKKYGVSVKETKGLFVNRYRIDAELDVPKLIQEHVSEGVSIPTGLFSQIDYTLVLDLPVKPAKSNADNIHGGKLTWDVPLDAKKAFYLEMGVPNVKNIVIAIVVVVLILAGVIVSLVMRRRRKKIS